MSLTTKSPGLVLQKPLIASASRLKASPETAPEALSCFPAAANGPYGLYPERYLDLARRSEDAVSMSIKASLNGTSPAGLIDCAKLIEQAGAAALELNMSQVPTNLLESGHDIERHYSEFVRGVCGSVDLPVSVKLTPYLSAFRTFRSHAGRARSIRTGAV